MKMLVLPSLVMALATRLMASVPSVPEVDANSAIGVITLVSGALLIMNARRK